MLAFPAGIGHGHVGRVDVSVRVGPSKTICVRSVGGADKTHDIANEHPFFDSVREGTARRVVAWRAARSTLWPSSNRMAGVSPQSARDSRAASGGRSRLRWRRHTQRLDRGYTPLEGLFQASHGRCIQHMQLGQIVKECTQARQSVVAHILKSRGQCVFKRRGGSVRIEQIVEAQHFSSEFTLHSLQVGRRAQRVAERGAHRRQRLRNLLTPFGQSGAVAAVTVGLGLLTQGGFGPCEQFRMRRGLMHVALDLARLAEPTVELLRKRPIDGCGHTLLAMRLFTLQFNGHSPAYARTPQVSPSSFALAGRIALFDNFILRAEDS